jgi:hypothetical protein
MIMPQCSHSSEGFSARSAAKLFAEAPATSPAYCISAWNPSHASGIVFPLACHNPPLLSCMSSAYSELVLLGNVVPTLAIHRLLTHITRIKRAVLFRCRSETPSGFNPIQLSNLSLSTQSLAREQCSLTNAQNGSVFGNECKRGFSGMSHRPDKKNLNRVVLFGEPYVCPFGLQPIVGSLFQYHGLPQNPTSHLCLCCAAQIAAYNLIQ